MVDVRSVQDFKRLVKRHDCVVIFLPKIGESGKFLPAELAQTKGLTGCTNQCKAYQPRLCELSELGYDLIAVSSMGADMVAQFQDGLGVSFIFVCDDKFELEKELNLETLRTDDGKKFYHRQTLIMRDGVVVKRFNKIADPQGDADNVIAAIKGL